MRLYVESNFLLELALEQEESESCEKLLALAESMKLELVVPAFAVLEPEVTLQRRVAEWAQTSTAVSNQLKQFRRTPFKVEASALEDLTLRVAAQAKARGTDVRRRILGVARILSTDAEVLRDAASLQDEHGLSLPDAVMLGSVLRDLVSCGSGPAYFANRNKHDFKDQDIESRLSPCKLYTSFSGVLETILGTLGLPNGSS